MSSTKKPEQRAVPLSPYSMMTADEVRALHLHFWRDTALRFGEMLALIKTGNVDAPEDEIRVVLALFQGGLMALDIPKPDFVGEE